MWARLARPSSLSLPPPPSPSVAHYILPPPVAGSVRCPVLSLLWPFAAVLAAARRQPSAIPPSSIIPPPLSPGAPRGNHHSVNQQPPASHRSLTTASHYRPASLAILLDATRPSFFSRLLRFFSFCYSLLFPFRCNRYSLRQISLVSRLHPRPTATTTARARLVVVDFDQRFDTSSRTDPIGACVNSISSCDRSSTADYVDDCSHSPVPARQQTRRRPQRRVVRGPRSRIPALHLLPPQSPRPRRLNRSVSQDDYARGAPGGTSDIRPPRESASRLSR